MSVDVATCRRCGYEVRSLVGRSAARQVIAEHFRLDHPMLACSLDLWLRWSRRSSASIPNIPHNVHKEDNR